MLPSLLNPWAKLCKAMSPESAAGTAEVIVKDEPGCGAVWPGCRYESKCSHGSDRLRFLEALQRHWLTDDEGDWSIDGCAFVRKLGVNRSGVLDGTGEGLSLGDIGRGMHC